MKKMRITTTLLAALSASALALAFTGCGDDHAHSHAENADAGHKEHAAGEHKGETHAEHAEHAKTTPGPNGGRLLTSVEPHLEFLVTEDRKVRISAVDDDNKVIPVTTQSVDILAGDRANPTRLAFAADGAGLLSDAVLPGGNDFPLVVQIKTGPGAETVREKFNLNLGDCPTCDYKEYACICGHEDGDHEGHEEGHAHKDEKK